MTIDMGFTENFKRSAKYECPTCGATKEIKDPHEHAQGQFPQRVPCGWRGCLGYAQRVDVIDESNQHYMPVPDE